MAIKNAQNLEDEILSALESVKTARAYVAQAHEVGNLAGKAIKLSQARMDYAEMKKRLGKDAPKIQVLEDPKPKR
jgi:hypothetical protein